MTPNGNDGKKDNKKNSKKGTGKPASTFTIPKKARGLNERQFMGSLFGDTSSETIEEILATLKGRFPRPSIKNGQQEDFRQMKEYHNALEARRMTLYERVSQGHKAFTAFCEYEASLFDADKKKLHKRVFGNLLEEEVTSSAPPETCKPAEEAPLQKETDEDDDNTGPSSSSTAATSTTTETIVTK